MAYEYFYFIESSVWWTHLITFEVVKFIWKSKYISIPTNFKDKSMILNEIEIIWHHVKMKYKRKQEKLKSEIAKCIDK